MAERLLRMRGIAYISLQKVAKVAFGSFLGP
jgi:hypothetical protein